MDDHLLLTEVIGDFACHLKCFSEIADGLFVGISGAGLLARPLKILKGFLIDLRFQEVP